MEEVIKGSIDDIPEELKPSGDLPPVGENPDEDIIPEEEDKEPENEPLDKEPEKTPDKSIQERDAQKAYWREKALKLEKRLKEKTPPAEKEGEEYWKMKIEFLLTHREVTEDEFDHIATVSASKSVSLSEAMELEDDYIKFRRRKVAEEKKTPAPSSSSFMGKSEEDINKMSADEFRKYEEEFQRKQQSRRAGI